MKADKRFLFIIAIFYAMLLVGILVFYFANPFENKCVKGNCLNGIGTYVYHSGMKYEGEWENGLRNGIGTLTYPEIYKYTGEWRNNKMDGQGTMMHSWYKYMGHWKRGNKDGKGIHWFLGDKYEGYWKNNVMHGQGTLTYAEDFKWVGEWKNGDRYSGHGTIIIKGNGHRYHGQMKNGKMYGQVIITYPDGSIFEGELINRNDDIPGTIIYPDGSKHIKRLGVDEFLFSW